MGQDFPSWAIEEIQTLVRAKLKNEEQEYRQLLIFCLVEIYSYLSAVTRVYTHANPHTML
jgi:hypothetical protein